MHYLLDIIPKVERVRRARMIFGDHSVVHEIIIEKEGALLDLLSLLPFFVEYTQNYVCPYLSSIPIF
jgi:hypothetical protein